MGQYWLHDIPGVLKAGVGKGIQDVILIHGWELRSRSSGGLDQINGVLKHHTASPETWDWDRDIEYIARTNPYAPSPVSQLYHSRDGYIAIIAAGAANHGGRGGQYHPEGPVYANVDRANYDLIGDEMGNAGTGEQWPWKQIEASITSDALICLAEKWGPNHVFAHKEYCGPGTTTPGRKIDPFGPWQNHPFKFWPDNMSWGGVQSNISLYRQLVAKKMTLLSQEVNIMHGFVPRPASLEPRILDTRGTGANRDAYKLNGNSTATINVPQGAGKSHAIANITCVEGEGAGYLVVWDDGDKPVASKLNWPNQGTVANEVTIPLAKDGTFKMWSKSRVHVIIDLTGYYQRM